VEDVVWDDLVVVVVWDDLVVVVVWDPPDPTTTIGPLRVVGAAIAKDEKEAEKTIEISDKTTTFLVVLVNDDRKKLLRLYIVLPPRHKFFIAQKPR
jgi:hypothetical protein